LRVTGDKTPKPIRFSRHAVENMQRRGTTEAEVSQTVNEAAWMPAKSDRFECARDFPYNGYWNGKFYKTKQIVPIFKKENDTNDTIVVITAYVFYF